MIDMMATRYHKLPSEILTNANTIDLYCMDLSLAYEKHCQNDNKPHNDFDINTLEDAVKQVKS